MIDPVTLAVVRGSLEQIADEMDLHLIHAAISPIISETNDCANGIFHPTTGETIAQGRYGLPVFLAYMQFTVQKVIELANAEGGFKPGDMWIMNDTYLGGSHLQDVQIIAPVFADGELFAVMATTGHWMDMGGNVPGGWAPRATEIHQEGMIIPPIKLYERGQGVDHPIEGTLVCADPYSATQGADVLAVLTEKRTALLPNAPTFVEAGYPGVDGLDPALDAIAPVGEYDRAAADAEPAALAAHRPDPAAAGVARADALVGGLATRVLDHLGGRGTAAVRDDDAVGGGLPAAYAAEAAGQTESGEPRRGAMQCSVGQRACSRQNRPQAGCPRWRRRHPGGRP